MRLLIVTNHFYPESFRVNDIAFDRVGKGDKVTVLTAIPDYPEGRFHNGYSFFSRRVERVGGVKIVRVPVIPRGNGGKIRMMLHYGSSVFFFFFYSLYQALFHRYDAVFVHDTSPAFISSPAQRVGRYQKIPVYHWILDMWPESLTAGGIYGGWIYKLVLRKMKTYYRRDKNIFIASRGFRKMLQDRGVEDGKIIYLPNWCDDAVDEGKNVASNKVVAIPKLPAGFILMFAGNLGEAQNLENVLKAAQVCREDKNLHFVFLGDGRKKLWMDEFVESKGLSDTVHLLGRYPSSTMMSFFQKADVLLVSLKNEMVFNMTLPAKVQSYMAAGKPIMGVLKGEGADIIAESECGWSVDPGNPQAIADTVREISRLPKEKLEELGYKAYSYYRNHFTKDICMDILEIINMKA